MVADKVVSATLHHQQHCVTPIRSLLACCREAQLEKKAARREAAKEREQSPDSSKLPGGGDIMGGDDSFAAAKARYHMFETSVSSLHEPPSANLLGRAKAVSC